MTREATIEIRLTTDEKARAQERAAREGVGLSELVRRLLASEPGAAIDRAEFNATVHKLHRRMPLARALREAWEETT